MSGHFWVWLRALSFVLVALVAVYLACAFFRHERPPPSDAAPRFTSREAGA